MGLLAQMQKEHKLLALFKICFKDLKSLINYQNCTIFVIQPDLVRQMEVVKPNSDKVYIQRSQLENGKA